MGLGTNGKQVLYVLTGLDRSDIVTIAQSLLRSDENASADDSPNNNTSRPVIYVDANNVIHKASRHTVDPVAHTAIFLKDWSQEGLIIGPICDGEIRPQSKQQTNKSRAERQRNKNKSVIMRQELRRISRQLKDGGVDEATRKKLEEEQRKLGTSIKTAETQSSNVVPKDFATLLEEQFVNLSAHSVQKGGGYVMPVSTAEFEADALIKGAFHENKFQMVMSNDADYPADLGDNCVSIKEFVGSKDLVISSTSKKTLTNAMSALDDASKAKVELIVPTYPLYEGIVDSKLRALISVIIGCDVCPGGVPGIGLKKMADELAKLKESSSTEEDIYNGLINYAKNEALTEEVLNTFVDAIIYQPTNKLGSDSERAYIGNTPERLPNYLNEFKSESTVIYDGPEVLQCNGTCYGSSHSFLAAVKHHECNKCKGVVCHLCSTKQNKTDDEVYCLPCFLMESLLPEEEEGQFVDASTKTIHEMRRELLEEYNFNGADNLSADEVEDAWLGYELQREMEAMADNVRFPVYDASAIDNTDNWEELAEIDFSEGASFLLNENIDDKYLPDILELLAAFVKFDSPGKKHTKWQKDGAVYKAIPQMFIDFANDCRISVCYRLLRRCLRHAFDGRTESLDNKTAKLIVCNGEVGIHISSPIPASMKKDIYDGETVITKDKILCAKCDCKSGAQNKERNVCVHSMPRGVLLSILLAEDLAEHVLLELTSMLTSNAVESDVWNAEQIEKAKKSVLILMEASGEIEIAKEAATKSSLFDMLQRYKTGTQQQKEWNRVHQPPKDDEIGPFEDIIVDSPECKAAEVFHRSSPKANLNPQQEEVKEFVPDYIRVGMMMNAFGFDPSKCGFIGHKLLETRRRKQSFDHNKLPQLLSAVQSEVRLLREEAESRSIRQSPKQVANLKQRPATPSNNKRKSDETRSQLVTPPPAKKRKSGKSGAVKCAKVGCNNVKGMDGVQFNRVPADPPDLPDGASLERQLTHRAKLELRRETMDRIGRSRTDTTKELRVCNCHPTETIRRRLYVNNDGTKASKQYDLTLIVGAGTQSSANPSHATKGVGKDRYVRNQLIELREDEEKARSSPETLPENASPADKAEHENIRLRGELAVARLEMQRIAELTSPDSRRPSPTTCPAVEKTAGFVEEKDKPSALSPNQKKRFGFKEVKGSLLKHKNGSTAKSMEKKQLSAHKPPTVFLNMAASEVKRRTGFCDVETLLAYVIVICNGDFEKIRNRVTSLTYFEEWFMYLECKFHETNLRQTDLEAAWGIDGIYINRVKDSKSAIDKAALRSWPRFASFEEDKELRDSQKWAKYDKYRVIQWDMTNIPAPNFSDPSLYRSMFSLYYNMCCLKIGVGVQLCGWVTPEKAWRGGVEDSQYHSDAGYLEAQKQFQESDLVDGKVVKFHNILDRGYRGNVAAHRKDQLSLQPPSARSDRRFKGKKTIYAGAVARDRSGNERGVRVMKRSGLFRTGFQASMSPQRFSDLCLTWGFQVNFMYNPPH